MATAPDITLEEATSELAAKVLSSLSQRNIGPGDPLEDVADKLGLAVKYVSLDLSPVEGRKTIYVSLGLSNKLARWKIASELSEQIVGLGDISPRDEGLASDVARVLLLMPYREFARIDAALYHSVDEIADHFGVRQKDVQIRRNVGPVF